MHAIHVATSHPHTSYDLCLTKYNTVMLCLCAIPHHSQLVGAKGGEAAATGVRGCLTLPGLLNRVNYQPEVRI